VPAIAPVEGKERLKLTDPDDLAALKRKRRPTTFGSRALCMGNNFNAEDKQFEIDWAVRSVRAAAALDAPCADRLAMTGERHLPWKSGKACGRGPQGDSCEDGIAEIDLGIENHGNQGNDPDFLEGLLAWSILPGWPYADSATSTGAGWPLSKVYKILRTIRAYREAHPHQEYRHPKEIQETQREIGYEYGKYVSPIHEATSIIRVIPTAARCRL